MNWSSIAMLVAFWVLGFYIGFKFGYTHGWRECIALAERYRSKATGGRRPT